MAATASPASPAGVAEISARCASTTILVAAIILQRRRSRTMLTYICSVFRARYRSSPLSPSCNFISRFSDPPRRAVRCAPWNSVFFIPLLRIVRLIRSFSLQSRTAYPENGHDSWTNGGWGVMEINGLGRSLILDVRRH